MAQEKTIDIMRQRLLINLFLLLCVIGLAVLLLTKPDEKIIEAEVTLTEIDPQDIHVIHVQRQAQDDIIFQKQDGHWIMQSPYKLPANPARINVMLKLLQAHSYDRFSAADNDLTPFLLAVPAVSIVLNDTRIAFGDTNPLEEKLRYVLIKDTVHLINDSLFRQLQAAPTFFLSSKLIPPETTIKSIQLPGVMIDNTEGNTLDGAQHQLITAWQNVEAVSIQKYKEVTPIDSIQIQLGNDETIIYLITSDAPNLILARPELGIQYHIINTTADNLFPVSAVTETVPE